MIENERGEGAENEITAALANGMPATTPNHRRRARWLLGNVFARRFVSSLFAEGGTGKTAVRVAQYCRSPPVSR